MAPPKNILVIGATGLIGRYIIQELIAAKDAFGRLAVFTSEDTAQKKASEIDSLKSKGVNIILGDLTNTVDIQRAYEGIDTVVSAVGRPIIDKQIKLLEIAENTPSVQYFYPSEFGTDIEFGDRSKDEKPHQLKLKVRKYIRENVHRLQYTFLVTGPFADGYIFGRRGNLQIGGFDAAGKQATLLGTGHEKISLTTNRDVGRLLVASLKKPEQSRNRALIVNSFTTTPYEILGEFEKQTGSKWEIQFTSLEELKKLEAEAWEKGLPFAAGFTLKRIWTEGGTLYDKTDNDVLAPVELDSLADIVRETIQKQTA